MRRSRAAIFLVLLACGGAPETPPPPVPPAKPVRPPPPPPPVGVEGATFTENSITASKRMYISDISCRGVPHGLAGMDSIWSGFDAKRAEIRGCVGNEVKTRIRWNASGGKMKDVKTGGDGTKANACLENALLDGATKSVDATCAITLWHDFRPED